MLLGYYEGVYLYISGYGTADQQTTGYYIRWRFDNQNYWMWNLYGTEGGLCEPVGEYQFTYGVELTQIFDGCGGLSADPELNPVGVFDLRQPDDSLILTQISGEICKEIRLVPHTFY